LAALCDQGYYGVGLAFAPLLRVQTLILRNFSRFFGIFRSAWCNLIRVNVALRRTVESGNYD